MNTKITVKDIIDITKGKLICGDENEICENFSRNTKEINQDDIFVGFKGDKFDGGKFYEDALKAGAKGCIINKIEGLEIKRMPGKFIIQVEDTVKAIGQIAKFKREKYHIPVIAITGSVGKTSTKDIIYSVVSQKYHTLKTQGNLNNHIGMPFTLLRLKDHEALVVEMGMNHFGELSYLTNIAQPTVAVITNVGTAHIGNLGSRENILKAKLEILEGLDKNGCLIINNDNDMLHMWNEKNKQYNVIDFGISNKSYAMAKEINLDGECSNYKLSIENNNYDVNVPIGGEPFVYNSLCAVCVGKALNISFENIISGIKNFKLTKNRMEIIKVNNITIINDCYNANFDSMKAGIENLAKMNAKRKIAILGDMLELGEYSEKLHKAVGKEVAKNNINELIVVGNESKNIAKEAKDCGMKEKNIHEFDKNNDVIKFIISNKEDDDCILIKASNGMHFIEIVDELKKQLK